MAAHWIWWILAAVLIGAELLTGTFYLLAVGVAFAVGGVAAWLGASMEVQLLIAGVLAVAGTMVAHHWRRRHGDPPHQPSLDLGQPVQVEVWNADGNGACTLSRHAVGRRGCDAGHTARRHDVHRRNARVDAAARRLRAGPSRCASTGCLNTNTRMNSLGGSAMPIGSSIVTLVLFLVALIVVVKAIRVVPQQHAWVVERLGRFHAVLQPGLNFVMPFVDRVAYRHDLREIPLDVPPQICITRDNTQLQVDGILYFQVTDPKLASYGSSNYVLAITQLAQTTLRSVIGRMELDKTFEERDQINASVVMRSTPPRQLGRQGAALRDQGPDAAGRDPALDAGADHRRAREARGDRDVGRPPAGTDQRGDRRARSGDRQVGRREAGGDQYRAGRGAAMLSMPKRTPKAIRKIARGDQRARRHQRGESASVAEQYITAVRAIWRRTNNTLIMPSNVADMAGLVGSTTMLQRQPAVAAR